MESSTVELVNSQNIAEVTPIAKSPAVTDALARECDALTSYLILQHPTTYVVEKYCDAHRVNEVFINSEIDKFDRFLLRIAKFSPFFTKVVDVYTAFLYKRSVFRTKIVLLMAILESCAPSYLSFEDPDADGLIGVGISVLGQGILFVLTLLLSLVALFPIFLVFTLNKKFFGGS